MNNHYRFTSGGRVEYEKAMLYLTLAGYYQYGYTPTGARLDAFYLQPEIKYTLNSTYRWRLGMEIFSGDNGKVKSAISHSFAAPLWSEPPFFGNDGFFRALSG